MAAKPPPSIQAAQAALKRKYRHLRRALGKDGMLFADEIFEIRPLEGEIWARSEIEVQLPFKIARCLAFGSSIIVSITREDRDGMKRWDFPSHLPSNSASSPGRRIKKQAWPQMHL